MQATSKRTKLPPYTRDQAIDHLNAEGFYDSWIDEKMIQSTIKDLERKRKVAMVSQAK